MTTTVPVDDRKFRRRIVVLNCNVSSTVSQAIDRSARAVAAPDTEIQTLTPAWGVASAEGYLDSQLAAVAMLDTIRRYQHENGGPEGGDGPQRAARVGPPGESAAGRPAPNRIDALVLAGFGEAGREACRELLDAPVVDITDAAAQVALHLAPRYGVVTTLSRAKYQILDSLRTAGVAENCVGVVAAEIAVLDVGAKTPDENGPLVRAARRLLDAGAEALVLGCAGMAGMDSALAEVVGVPVIDPVAAGVVLAESLVRLGLRTSKVCSYGSPLPKARPGWDEPVAIRSPARS